MKGITYGITEELYSLNGSERRAYGIAVYADADEDGTVTVLTSIRDITPDKERLKKLVNTCNRLELSPIHLEDVIEDFLSD